MTTPREAAFEQLLGGLSKEIHIFELGINDLRPRVITPWAEPSDLFVEKLVNRAKRVRETGESLSFRQARPEDGVRTWWQVRLVPVLDEEGRVSSIVGSAREDRRERLTKPAVRKEDRIHQRLLELLPDAVIITDVNGRLLYINSAGVQLLGVQEPADVLGQSVWDMIHPEDLLRARERGRLIRRGVHVDLVEHKLVRSDGAVVPIETASVPARYGGKKAVLTTARDVSSRKDLEEALSESQELFYKAFLTGPAAYSITRASDGLLIDVNEEYVKLSGYERSELLGKSTQELGFWVDPKEREALRDEVARNKSVHGKELTFRRRDGEIRKLISSLQAIDVQGEPCLLAVAVDVTERERAAMAERESRSLFHRVFHASPAAIAIIRLVDNHLLDVNEQWRKLTGYGLEDVDGKTIFELDLWGDFEDAEEALRLARDRNTPHDFEMLIRTRPGGERTVLASFQQIQIEGEPSLLAVLTDITERKAMELELIRSKEHAEEMSRIKTAFLTNMTHEVRTPLTVILGFTSMLRQGVREEYQRFVKVIERSGRRLLLMLDSILDLAQLEAGSLTTEQQMFSIADVVQIEADAFRLVAEEKGLHFELTLPTERAAVQADHKIFLRVLNNLFDNAVKFTEEGSISLHVKVVDGYVQTILEDTGIGIDVGFLPHIFDEFAQESTGLERTHQGSGLGLTVSRRLMELIGGAIEVESRKGRGSRFIISLPRAGSDDL